MEKYKFSKACVFDENVMGVYDYSKPIDDEYLDLIKSTCNALGLDKELADNEYSDKLKVISTNWYDVVYYLHDYYPTSRFGSKAGNYILRGYKDKSSDSAFRLITLELEAAIDAIIADYKPELPIHLVAVPSSEKEKTSAIAGSIAEIIKHFEERYQDSNYTFIDDSDLIIRKKNVDTFNLSGSDPRDPLALKETLSVKRPLGDSGEFYIIIDDIVTTGSTMHACKNLIENSCDYPDLDDTCIVSLAVGRTADSSSKELSIQFAKEQAKRREWENRAEDLIYGDLFGGIWETTEDDDYDYFMEEICEATGETAEEFWEHEP